MVRRISRAIRAHLQLLAEKARGKTGVKLPQPADRQFQQIQINRFGYFRIGIADSQELAAGQEEQLGVRDRAGRSGSELLINQRILAKTGARPEGVEVDLGRCDAGCIRFVRAQDLDLSVQHHIQAGAARALLEHGLRGFCSQQQTAYHDVVQHGRRHAGEHGGLFKQGPVHAYSGRHADSLLGSDNGDSIILPLPFLRQPAEAAGSARVEYAPMSAAPKKLSETRVVLVETSHPGNIGAAARAVKTMGVGGLWLVAPRNFPSREADAMASGARDMLARARVVGKLDEAVSDCQWVVGTSARRRWFNDLPLTPREFAGKAATMRAGQRVALVFGRERTGLTNEEVDLCHGLVEIPANPEYNSLNLASAVQVLCYELRVAALAGQAIEDKRRYPTATDVENFYTHLQQVLLKTGFLDPANPRHLMRRLRQLFGRIRMDDNELKILRGILTSFETPKKRKPLGKS